MNKICWALAAILLIACLIMAYKFLLQGAVYPAADGRTAVALNAAERDLVLREMRSFLVSTQGILKSIVSEDLASAAKYARQVGTAAQQGMPSGLRAKLPMAFKQLGFDTHSRFDQLAMDVEALEDPDHALKQLAELMGNCVACHASYRFTEVGR